MRPRRLAHRKAHKGFFKVNSGGSLAGTVPYYGDFGLQVACMGGRLEDRQLENARTAIRRVIKAEKGSKMFLRTFPDRPVTSKGSEARMGKGKGAFDYHAKWVSEGAIIFEVSGVRRETAAEAMRVAGAVLPVHTRMVESPSIAAGGVGGGVGGGVDGNVVMHSRVAPRCLPHFIKKKLDAMEFQRFQRKSPEAPSITETVISTMTTTGTDVAAN